MQADNYNNAYLITWGLENGIRSSMIELLMPSSPQDIINQNFSGKFIAAFENILSRLFSKCIYHAEKSAKKA